MDERDHKAMNEISENHEKFKGESDPFKKLEYAAKNVILQIKSAKHAISELNKLAKIYGYVILEDDGTLMKINCDCSCPIPFCSSDKLYCRKCGKPI